MVVPSLVGPAMVPAAGPEGADRLLVVGEALLPSPGGGERALAPAGPPPRRPPRSHGRSGGRRGGAPLRPRPPPDRPLGRPPACLHGGLPGRAPRAHGRRAGGAVRRPRR